MLLLTETLQSKNAASTTIQKDQNRQLNKKNRQNDKSYVERLTLIGLSFFIDFLAKETLTIYVFV